MWAFPVTKTGRNLLGRGLINVGHRDVGAFLGQPSGTRSADTVPATSDYHRSPGEAFTHSLLHERSLPLPLAMPGPMCAHD
jgi:hypothetical protein